MITLENHFQTHPFLSGLASFVISHVILLHFVQHSTSLAVSGAQLSPQRQRYGGVSDAFPAPNSGEYDMFIKRVLRWHEHYCGKNRVCKDYTASNCYRCSPCQCDLTCREYGDCCPDIALEAQSDDFPRPFTGSDTNVMTCESSDLHTLNSDRTATNNGILASQRDSSGQKSGTGHESKKYFMISRCPHTFTHDAGECENTDKVSPVTSGKNDSSDVYKNINCARCHGVHDVISWNIRISCEKRKNLTSFHSPYEVVTMSLLEPDCRVTYIPPPSKEARQCFTEPEMIIKCNVTGKWFKRDSFLERSCHSYLTPKRVNDVLYKNVYCFLCNHGDDPATEIILTSCQTLPQTGSAAMMATLRHSDVVKKEERNSELGDVPYELCGKQGIYDKTEDSCREVICELGQYLSSGSCQPMFQTARGVGYELYFGLRPRAPIDLSGDHDLLHHLPAEMEVYLGKTLLQGKVKLQDFAMAFNTTGPEGRCSQTSTDLGVYARLVSQSLVGQGELQDELLRVRHANFNIQIRTWDMSFQAFPSESAWHVMHPSRRLSPQTLTTCVIIVSNSHLEQRKDGIMRVGTTTPDPTMVQGDQTPPHIRMSSLLHCPHVHLLPHEYSSTGPDGELKLVWTDAALPSNRYLMDLERNATICLSDFTGKFGDPSQKRSSLEVILACVLLGISIICLFVCFIVFLLFAVLRSLPGKNNIVFVVCLFLSQASLLVGYVIDDDSIHCAYVGIPTHYFALCVFCALVVCSYHVYAMFTTMHLSSNVRRDRRVMVSYCCFTFLVPLAVVALVIITHVLLETTFTFFGYGAGGFVCLLSSRITFWISLFLPLMASIIIAIVLYCLTTSSLRHNKDLEVSATDERHVNFYFRAAILTSVTWIVGTLGIVLSLSPVRIAFIVLQCLLGMYVFASLVLTPRVTRLLSGACCQSRRPPRGRTSLNMKMASSQDCPIKPPCIMGTGYRRREPNAPSGGGIVHVPGNRYVRRTEFGETIA